MSYPELILAGLPVDPGASRSPDGSPALSGTFAYSHLTASGTTTLKNGPGALGCVVVNTKAGASGTITVYDSTTAAGSVVAVVDATVSGTYSYNVVCTVGITVVVSGSAPGDSTVAWR